MKYNSSFHNTTERPFLKLDIFHEITKNVYFSRFMLSAKINQVWFVVNQFSIPF